MDQLLAMRELALAVRSLVLAPVINIPETVVNLPAPVVTVTQAAETARVANAVTPDQLSQLIELLRTDFQELASRVSNAPAMTVRGGGLTADGLTKAVKDGLTQYGAATGSGTTGGLTNTELRSSKVLVGDIYPNGEVLADQVGAGAVLTFTFSNPMNLIWVLSSGTTLVSRCDPFGGIPDASLGIYCEDGIPVPVTVTATTIKVFAPIGTTVRVYGYRY